MHVPVNKTFGNIKALYTTYENPKIAVAAYNAEGTQLALLVDDEGRYEKLTINVADQYGELPRNHIAVKNYSEGEGLAVALENAGFGTIITDNQHIGFGTFSILELSFDAEKIYQDSRFA